MGTHRDHRRQLSTREVQQVKGEQKGWHVNIMEDIPEHTEH